MSFSMETPLLECSDNLVYIYFKKAVLRDNPELIIKNSDNPVFTVFGILSDTNTESTF